MRCGANVALNYLGDGDSYIVVASYAGEDAVRRGGSISLGLAPAELPAHQRQAAHGPSDEDEVSEPRVAE